MDTFTIIALIISGVLVGFINTLAGGGTVISITLFMFLGIPPTSANATNRIPVIIQTLTAVFAFKKKQLLDLKEGLRLAIPTIIGTFIGAQIAVSINETTFKNTFAIVLIVMAFFMMYNPSKWLTEREQKISNWVLYFFFFLVGVYGGFIHVGVGYFILMTLVLGGGHNIIKANALKSFIVLMYTPFALFMFSFGTKIYWEYGLIHAIGNFIGATIASNLAFQKGVGFVRWVVIAVVIFIALQTFGIIDINSFLKRIAF